ncbi:MAG: hypothetical protein IKR11_05490, partial [Solobacterium sp.]|nr:hypothetical protein [Solobacterium sp.]
LMDESGNFQPCTQEDSVIKYTEEEAVDDEGVWKWFFDIYYIFPDSDKPIEKRTGKIVVDYTYPDGISETYETEVFNFYKGYYVRLNTNYGKDGMMIGSEDITFDYIIDDEWVDPDQVDVVYTYLDYKRPEDTYYIIYEDEPEKAFYTGTDGKRHLRLSYALSGLPSGTTVYLYTGFEYNDSSGSLWASGDSGFITIE